MWLPILAPVIFSLAVLFSEGIFRFDYLLPAELFPMGLIGGGLLFRAASQRLLHRKLISWSLVIAVGSLILGQILAVVTGLASGEIGPSGWPWLLVTASIIIYSLALIGVGVGGLLLLRNFYHPPEV